MIRLIKFALTKLEKLEILLFIFGFIAMLLIAISEIIARNLFEINLYWSDSSLRLLLLWITLLGAMLAARHDKHIKVDFFENFTDGTLLRVIKSIRCIATALICAVIAYASYEFIAIEYEYGEIAVLNIPVWVSAIIIPCSFFIMSLRYFCQFIRTLFLGEDYHD